MRQLNYLPHILEPTCGMRVWLSLPNAQQNLSYATTVTWRCIVVDKLLVAAGLAGAIWAVPTAQVMAADSQTFIKNAIQGNLAEESLGKLGQQKAGSDKVKQFSQMLVTD